MCSPQLTPPPRGKGMLQFFFLFFFSGMDQSMNQFLEFFYSFTNKRLHFFFLKTQKMSHCLTRGRKKDKGKKKKVKKGIKEGMRTYLRA